MRETAWFLTDVKDNAAISEAQPASLNQVHVVTGIYAGFSNAATAGTLTITVGLVTVMTLRFTGQITLNGIEIPGSAGQAVSVGLNASGAGGTFGSVLLNGYTK